MTTMVFPVPVDPVVPSTSPRTLIFMAPWTGAQPAARLDQFIHLGIDTVLLRDDGSAVLVEPPHGAQLFVSSVVLRDPGYVTLRILQRPSRRSGLPTVHVFMHSAVLGTPASPWLGDGLRGFTASVPIRLPSGILHYKATFDAAAHLGSVLPTPPRASTAGPLSVGGPSGGESGTPRRSARLGEARVRQ